MSSMIIKDQKYELHYSDVRGDVLRYSNPANQYYMLMASVALIVFLAPNFEQIFFLLSVLCKNFLISVSVFLMRYHLYSTYSENCE